MTAACARRCLWRIPRIPVSEGGVCRGRQKAAGMGTRCRMCDPIGMGAVLCTVRSGCIRRRGDGISGSGDSAADVWRKCRLRGLAGRIVPSLAECFPVGVAAGNMESCRLAVCGADGAGQSPCFAGYIVCHRWITKRERFTRSRAEINRIVSKLPMPAECPRPSVPPPGRPGGSDPLRGIGSHCCRPGPR